MVAAGDPVRATDVSALADYTTGKPLVRLVQQIAQSIPNAVTYTAITFSAGSEDIDTHGFHDVTTNNSRVTPTIAGYYRVRGAVAHGLSTTYTTIENIIRLNGVTNLAPSSKDIPNATNAVRMRATEVMVALNGSTDYVENCASQSSGGAVNTNVSVQYTSTLEVEFLRPL